MRYTFILFLFLASIFGGGLRYCFLCRLQYGMFLLHYFSDLKFFTTLTTVETILVPAR